MVFTSVMTLQQRPVYILRCFIGAPISSNEDFSEHFQVATCSMALNQPSSVNCFGSCAHFLPVFVLFSVVSPGTTLHDCTVMCPRFKWTMTFPFSEGTKHNISQSFLGNKRRETISFALTNRSFSNDDSNAKLSRQLKINICVVDHFAIIPSSLNSFPFSANPPREMTISQGLQRTWTEVRICIFFPSFDTAPLESVPV